MEKKNHDGGGGGGGGGGLALVTFNSRRPLPSTGTTLKKTELYFLNLTGLG